MAMADAARARAGAMPLITGLPDEIVIWEILVRLPPKSLLRCGAVRRAWRSATSTRDFLLAHHGHQPALPLLHCDGCVSDEIDSLDIIQLDNRAGVPAADDDQLHSVARLRTRSYKSHDIRLQYSCDGLLVLFLNLGQNSIYNPATRQYAPLRQLSGFLPLGMYPHSPTGEYRLLLLAIPTPGAPDGGYVFSLGSGEQPRYIGCPDGVKLKHLSLLSAQFHGNLYWYINSMIMVFDTVDESFRLIQFPNVFDSLDLFEMGDMLCMSGLNYERTIIEIWAIQDYQGEVWGLKYRVELPVAEISVQFGKFDCYWSVVVTTSQDGNVLVLVKFDDCLLQVDKDGRLVASFHRKGLAPARLRLKQSLVSHAFFSTLEGYVVNDSPFDRMIMW